DLDHQLAATDRPATEGRHPLPAPAAFATAMGSLGIGNDTLVIAYDDTGGLTAGRLVVMLRMLGCDAAVLAGGLDAWTGAIETGEGRKRPSAEFTATDWPSERLATADDVEQIATAGGVVLDARSRERFLGEAAQIDKRPGHIPGARSAPWSAVLDADAIPRSPTDLHDHYRNLGIDDGEDGHRVVAYCGSGVSACMNVLAMEHAGLGIPRLYVASWSGWSADPDREAAAGE
ncbi:MAG: rhodanese-like domain-containing protein, partial [Actinomycetota bacterium]|nr:rhodanese-like domain-containing protein [Actinomycetota bacterium]